MCPELKPSGNSSQTDQSSYLLIYNFEENQDQELIIQSNRSKISGKIIIIYINRKRGFKKVGDFPPRFHSTIACKDTKQRGQGSSFYLVHTHKRTPTSSISQGRIPGPGYEQENNHDQIHLVLVAEGFITEQPNQHSLTRDAILAHAPGQSGVEATVHIILFLLACFCTLLGTY